MLRHDAEQATLLMLYHQLLVNGSWKHQTLSFGSHPQLHGEGPGCIYQAGPRFITMQSFAGLIEVLDAWNLFQDWHTVVRQVEAHLTDRLTSQTAQLFIRHSLKERFADVRCTDGPLADGRFRADYPLAVALAGACVTV